MLLQPALGGNARTTVLVTASSEEKFGDETLHSLRFGERCAAVKSKNKNNGSLYASASMEEVMMEEIIGGRGLYLKQAPLQTNKNTRLFSFFPESSKPNKQQQKNNNNKGASEPGCPDSPRRS